MELCLDVQDAEGSQLEQLGSAAGRVGWSSMAQSSQFCLVYLCLSGGTQCYCQFCISSTFSLQICFPDVLCRNFCRVVTETPMWIFVS